MAAICDLLTESTEIPYMAHSVLVTGGAGFIGSHVVRSFASQDYAVTVLDDLSSGKRVNLPEGVTFVEDDIRTPSAAALVRDGKFDVICHLAAQIDVRKSVTDPAYDVAVNVGGSLNLLEAVRQSGRTSTRFIFSSTGGALYGDVETLPTPESFPKDPQSPYGNAKLSVELYLGYYARVHGLDTVALRYGNVYGPRQDSHGEAGVVAIFCERVLSGRKLTVFGDGRQTRDYVYVADVANANYLAATRPLPPAGPLDSRSFNIGTGVETSVLQLAELVRDASGTTPAIEHAPERAGEVLRSVLLADRAKEVLGWRPRMSIADGIAETYRWFAAEQAGATGMA
jgi:UDP-glucose 4-epimerase